MATSPNATPTPITPPRVPLIDARTGLIDRAWYMFFLSLFRSAQFAEDPLLEPNAESLIASYDAALRALEQQTSVQPPIAGVTELAQEVDQLRQEVKTLPQPQLGTFAALQQANLPWTTFDTTPEHVPTDIGTVAWDGGTTLGIQMTASVLQQVGESEYVYAKASSAITKGQLCYHTGAVGASGVVTVAPTPLALTDPNQLVGVAAETIALNGFGLIQVSGVLRGFNTTGSSVGETWADGDPLYYNPAYVGSMTKVKPLAPNQKSYIGEVISAGSGGSGSMHVRIVPGTVLGGTDSNVEIISAVNNDVLVYDSVDQRWENYAPTAARDALGLGTGNPTNGQMLIGNGTDFTTAALTAGTGIAVTNGAGSATIATNLSAGTGISLSGTAPQTIATNLAAGANISITGSPTQTIAVTGLGSMAFQSTGATGSFISANTPAKTVTVTNGIITSIV